MENIPYCEDVIICFTHHWSNRQLFHTFGRPCVTCFDSNRDLFYYVRSGTYPVSLGGKESRIVTGF